MKRTHYLFWPFLSLVAGCTPYAAKQERPIIATSAPASSRAVEKIAEAATAGEDAPVVAPTPIARTPERRPGDFAVFRFSGRELTRPVTVWQRISSRQGDIVQMDVTLVEDNDGAGHELRVRMDELTGEVLSVARLDKGVRRPFGVAAYEELMQRTIPSVEANEMLLGTSGVLVTLGDTDLACTRSSYRVRVGPASATLHTLESDTFPWGDVGGEIVADDGTVLYRAELVDFGNAADAAKRERALAVQGEEGPYDGLEELE